MQIRFLKEKGWGRKHEAKYPKSVSYVEITDSNNEWSFQYLEEQEAPPSEAWALFANRTTLNNPVIIVTERDDAIVVHFPMEALRMEQREVEAIDYWSNCPAVLMELTFRRPDSTSSAA